MFPDKIEQNSDQQKYIDLIENEDKMAKIEEQLNEKVEQIK
jgi:hypothetical protein